MANLHEVLFQWPHTEPTTVIVTGTFDQWSSSMQLTKGPTSFKGSTTIPWDEKIAYKFIVDGQWMVVEHEPTELDHDGNVNNVYTAPPKPPSSALEADSPVLMSPSFTDHPTSFDNATSEPGAAFPQIVADLAETLAACEGTTSALNYVASGLETVIHNVIGINPINAEQIPLPSTNPDTLLGVLEEQVPSPVPGAGPSVAPVVIVPVNVSENNMIVTDPVPLTVHEDPPTISMEKTVGAVAEEPSTHAIVSTRYTASVIGEAALIYPDTGITTNRPPETIASAAHPESTGLVLNEPQIVTTPPASMSSSEPVAEASPSPEASESKSAVTAEAPQPQVPTITAMNGTSTPKLDPASTIKTAENTAAPDAMIDEKISQVEPASSPPTSEPHTNGHGPVPANVQTPSAPTTPVKKSQQPFPSSSTSNSPTKSFASKVGADSRKKKTSIFGKVKHLFSHDKEKGKERK